MDNILEELGIPKKYLKSTNNENRFIALVHKLWLKSLIKHLKLVDFIEKNSITFDDYQTNNSWSKIFICIYKKKESKVIPLPRIRRVNNNRDEQPLIFAQLLEYIYQTNYKNLWKEAYKKYNSTTINETYNKETQITLVDYNNILKEIITRIYGCPIINIYDTKLNLNISNEFDVNLNILPALCAIETLNNIFLLHLPYFEHNLKDCVTFSPAILEKCYSKPLFIIYQLLQVLKSLHDNSLTLGDITLNDIYLNEDMWIYIIPSIKSNIYNLNELKTNEMKQLNCKKFQQHQFDINLKCLLCGIRTFDKIQITNEDLLKLCQYWIDGKISNFTYITILNKLSGRKLNDPNCHYVFPWVTDFQSPCGKNWRDLKKSKFRLNKGDRQLDLTYETIQINQVPHHVSDVLSSITYYVYMARRTPKTILCKNVRTVWVPAEYPSSIQRLQEWTPDECIPEFFTDPNVFLSIHDDLDDLEIPNWCSSPEEFIEKHRTLLESSHVSERLHHWIDLTFGYKLAGNAAIKAKNVCLNLVDEHVNLTQSGIVQLFTQPHPQKAMNSVFWAKTPPKIFINKSIKQKSRDRSNSPGISYEIKTDDDSDDLLINQRTLSRFLSRSRSSLNDEQQSNSKLLTSTTTTKSLNQRSASLGPKNPTFTSHVKPQTNQLIIPQSTTVTTTTINDDNIIYLPKEYKPELALDLLEKKYSFISNIFHPENDLLNVNNNNNNKGDDNNLDNTECVVVQNAFTNLIFQENYEKEKLLLRKNMKSHTFPLDNQSQFVYNNINNKLFNNNNENQINCNNYLEIISSRRIRELQILGCLIVEIFMAKQLRSLGANNANLTFNERLKFCLTIIKSYEIPPCINYIVKLLLQPKINNLKEFKYPTITNYGLPSPNSHLLLEPLLNNLIPFSKHYYILFKLIKSLKDFQNITNELNILYYFDCNGDKCLEYETIERTKILFEQNISECKVKLCAKYFELILNELNTTIDFEIINLLILHVKELIEEPSTSVLAAWYLFDPFSKVLGTKKTCETLLDSILKLYENETNDNNFIYNCKIAKLYHHSFLLRLIVRLGLKCFLENFVTPLVEAVGRYKDYDKIDFIYHTHKEKIIRKTSHLKTLDNEQTINNDISTTSDDSSLSSCDKQRSINTNNQTIEPQVFEFDEDTTITKNDEELKTLIEHLELNVTNDLPFNHSTAEEALDATVVENLEQLRNLEELNLYLNNDDDCNSLNGCGGGDNNNVIISPTIPIPSTSFKSSNDYVISCEVGSKKSESSNNSSLNNEQMKKIVDGKKSKKSFKNNMDNNNNNGKISDMSSDSLIWLSHRLGPVLTARYLSRNLLKMLTLCYVGKENLIIIQNTNQNDKFEDDLFLNNYLVVGDQNAYKVLECLISIAGLYGEQLILFQYIPHMSELIALCKRRLTSNLEGGLISCLALLKHIIPYLSDSTLMDQLQDVILKNILHPTVRLLGSTKYTFPSGSLARNVLARKYLSTLYMLSIRIGSDMTRTHLAVPALQRFFLIFDKIRTITTTVESNIEEATNQQIANSSTTTNDNLIKSIEESHYLELRRDGTTTEWAISGRQITHVRLKDSESADSLSPPIPLKLISTLNENNIINLSLDELKNVFTSELAYLAYIPFLKHIGLNSLELSLKNHNNIHDLCQEYENEMKLINNDNNYNNSNLILKDNENLLLLKASTSIGSNISLIGNRIDVQNENINTNNDNSNNTDLLSLVSNRMEINNRHLRGNWLAYWEHEIGRSNKDLMFNFKQIKLQTFIGHTNSVKSLYVLDNENSFISGSRDKTVKLWSLRSQGDGTFHTNCQWTYTAHKKSILSLTFIDNLRLVASCDSTVHIWDPFMGVNVGHLESSKYPPVNVLKSMPSPSTLVFAATTDGTIKIIDTRLCNYIYELKISLNPAGLIRCLAISPSGTWLAAGQSSGNITIFDTRTGLILSSWRGHENEVLQLVALDDFTLISSSLDQNISVWNVSDGKFKFNMRGTTEPVHCLNIYNNELITGTTANRIGVHTSISIDASFSSTKLRSDAFKGLLTSMALMPLNRLLLLGADTGNINLLC